MTLKRLHIDEGECTLSVSQGIKKVIQTGNVVYMKILLIMGLALMCCAFAYSRGSQGTASKDSPTPAAGAPPAPALAPCLIVKHKGTIGKRLLWTALIGVPIAPGASYDYVDNVNYQTPKMSYKGKALQKLESTGVKVVVLNDKFTSSDLQVAQQSCRGVASPPTAPSP